jgi:hypothetical protein
MRQDPEYIQSNLIYQTIEIENKFQRCRIATFLWSGSTSL